MARILIVEDEEDLAGLLEYNLEAEGHNTEVSRTGGQAIARARAHPPDLVLLDLMLPDVPGSEIARLLRAEPALSGARIIMVTAKGEEADRVKGLELGADDYVVKPFSVKELLLRVRAVLRRSEAPAAEVLTHRAIKLDPSRHEASVDGSPVALTALEFRLLRTFLERPGRVQTREKLLSHVWGIDAEVTTRTVDTHIKRLREKLGGAGEGIETVRGVGYRLAAE
ncbi:MAG: winged helix-turn-helix domain-containing protein [Myxococcales bacterium]|nr:winged helix-turn-helix domain-containing protein [Myxococcales bacterium]